MKNINNLSAIAIIVVCCLLIQFLFFGHIMWQPNDVVVTVGGDGLIIHYNMLYHILNGGGVTLQSWNFPHHELLFLTDAQASLTLVLRFVQQYLLDISNYVIGISNVILLYTIPLTAIFLFKILKELGVSTGFAIVGSILICYLSPQLMRIFCGHYGIGYNFLIPMYILWIQQFLKGKQSLWFTILVVAALLFFGFNNPYTLLISCFIFLSVGLMLLFFYRNEFSKSKITSCFMMGFVPLALVFVVIKSLDKIEDRVLMPWGFFHNATQWKSIFLPQRGYIYEVFHKTLGYTPAPWESQVYIGLTTAILLLAGLIFLIIKRKEYSLQKLQSSYLTILVLSAIPVLIFLFSTELFRWLDIQNGPLTAIYQFRAPGRFGWIVYFIFGITAVYVAHSLYQRYRSTHGVLVACSLLLLVQLWVVDDIFYLKSIIKPYFSNPFKEARLEEYRSQFLSKNLNPDDYVGIYSIPMQQGWTDKIVTDDFWNAQFHGINFSAATGIPHINAKLSRMSVSQTLESVQLLSNEAIQKSLVKKLGENSKILLFEGVEAPLTENEKQLLKKAKHLYDHKGYRLHELSLDHITSTIDAQDTLPKTPLYHYDGDHESDTKFCGEKAILFEKGGHQIQQIGLDNVDKHRQVSLSIWSYVSHEKYGAPKVHFELIDDQGNITKKITKEATRSQDTQDGWVRLSAGFQLAQSSQSIRVSSEYGYQYILDELSMSYLDENTIYQTSDCVLYNNFKI